MYYDTIFTYTTTISLIINCSDILVFFLTELLHVRRFLVQSTYDAKSGRMLHLPATDEGLDLGGIRILDELYRMYSMHGSFFA
jgi:hypothetical protein